MKILLLFFGLASFPAFSKDFPLLKSEMADLQSTIEKNFQNGLQNSSFSRPAIEGILSRLQAILSHESWPFSEDKALQDQMFQVFRAVVRFLPALDDFTLQTISQLINHPGFENHSHLLPWILHHSKSLSLAETIHHQKPLPGAYPAK